MAEYPKAAPMASVVPGRLRARNQGSCIARQRLGTWLRDCDELHNCRTGSRYSPLPTRVLFVETDSPIVELYETHGDRGEYIALSHCWGQSHRITTTTDNIESHKRGIPIDELPKTFRDAILLAQDLDIPYVWIDSLCIVQDDPEDWENEASRMGEVYANAYLTVAAAASTDDSTGCFPDQEIREETRLVSADTRATGRRTFPYASPLVAIYTTDEGPQIIYHPWYLWGVWKSHNGPYKGTMLYFSPEWMPSSLKSKPKKYLIGEFGVSFDPIADEVLSKRGWTLQERLLSPRTVHYGIQEMYWECQACVLAEDGAYLVREFMAPDKLAGARPLPLQMQKLNSEDSASEKPKRPWPDPWHKLVEDYTSRNITFEQDKFPAISGSAKTITKTSGDTYCAGLWRSTIIEDLYWAIEVSEHSHYCDDPAHDAAMPPPTKSQVTYPKEYRAPSWSWASLDGKIQFWSLEDKSICAECIEVKVVPAGKDPFGRLAEGSITLKVSSS